MAYTMVPIEYEFPNDGTIVWNGTIIAPGSGGPVTLQDAYVNGNAIAATLLDGPVDINNTGAPQGLIVRDGGTAKFQVVAGGTVEVGSTDPLSMTGVNSKLELNAEVTLPTGVLAFTRVGGSQVVRTTSPALDSGIAGDSVTYRSGSGAAAGVANPGGAGGETFVAGGPGGAASATQNAGDGEVCIVRGGFGGAGVAGGGESGDGADAVILGGDAGGVGATQVGDHNGGNVGIDAGAGINAGIAGAVGIGGANAAVLSLMRSGVPTNVLGTLAVSEEASFSADMEMTGDFEFLPTNDAEGSIGNGSNRFNLVRAVTITSGDIGFDDAGCALCGREFGEGDDIVLRVKKIEHDAAGRRVSITVPVHAGCR